MPLNKKITVSGWVCSALFLLASAPALVSAAEPGALTIVVKDRDIQRPIADAVVNVRERETSREQTLTSNSEGRVIVENLDPGLYSIVISKTGFSNAAEPSVRVATRKNLKVEFELSARIIEEVVVRAQQADAYASASSTYLDREALRSAVGGGADPLQALDGLPGLASSSEFASFSVRGRGPRDNLVLVDEFPFDKAVHFDATLGEVEDVGGGGRFSIFAPKVIGGAEFSPGGWGAAYGGRSASLLKLDVAGGNPSPSTSLRLDLAGFELGYDGPAGITEDSTLLVSARRLDFGSFFETIGERDIGEPVLRDIIVKSVVPIDANNTLEVLLMDTHEDYERDVTHVFESPDFEDVALLTAEQDSDLYGLTLRTLIGKQATWTNKVYYRRSDKVSTEGEAFPDLVPVDTLASGFPIRENIISVGEDETEFGWRSDFETLNRWGVFNAGLRVNQVDVDYDTTLSGDWIRYVYDEDDFRPSNAQRFIVLTPADLNSQLSQKELNYAGYVEQVFEAGSWDVRTGLRFEQDGFSDESLIAPRFSINWRPGASGRYFATAGMFHQSPRFLELAADANNGLKNEEITHLSAGFEYFPVKDWSVLVEAYYQNLDKLVVDQDRVSGTFTNAGEGTSLGADLVVTGTLREGLYATATYSYNDSEVDRKDGRGDVVADFNREHVATLGLTWELNDRWKIAGRYKFLSGRPEDAFVIHDNVLGVGEPLRFSKEITERNAGRFDSFGLLNVRVDYRRSFGPLDLTAFLDVINVTGASSSDDIEFDPRRGIEVEDDSGAEPLIGFRVDYAW